MGKLLSAFKAAQPALRDMLEYMKDGAAPDLDYLDVADRARKAADFYGPDFGLGWRADHFDKFDAPHGAGSQLGLHIDLNPEGPTAAADWMRKDGLYLDPSEQRDLKTITFREPKGALMFTDDEVNNPDLMLDRLDRWLSVSRELEAKEKLEAIRSYLLAKDIDTVIYPNTMEGADPTTMEGVVNSLELSADHPGYRVPDTLEELVNPSGVLLDVPSQDVRIAEEAAYLSPGLGWRR